jgi:hypothetical protein
MRRISIIVALVLGGAFATAAAADAPTKVEQSFHRSIPNFVVCPGFTVVGEFDVNRTVFTFTDDVGTPIRTVTHVHFVGTLTNTATGKSIDDEGNQIVTVDLLTGKTIVDGRIRVDTEPGEGVILQQTGRTVRDAQGHLLFLAGVNDLISGMTDDFCGYMASL